MRSRVGVKAVWDSDLEELLTGLGIYDDFTAGLVKCSVCGKTVGLDAFGSVTPRAGGMTTATCDDTLCVREVTVAARDAVT